MADPGRLTRRRPRWCGRLLVTVGMAALLVGCGEDAAPRGVTDSSLPDALPGTPAEVEEALLTTGDLGEGWVDLGAVPLDERGFEDCPETRVVTGGEDPARLGEAQSLYAEGDPPVPTFGESISLWESPEVAAERLATSASVPSECGSFEQEMVDGTTATVRVLPRDAPQLGDEAMRMVVEFDQDDGPTILRDVVVVRIGDVLVLTEGADLAEDDPRADRQQERFDELTRQAVDKATRFLSD